MFFRFSRQCLLYFSLGLIVATQSSANDDFRQIADYFELPLNPVIGYEQQIGLGPEYRRYFKTTGDFNYKSANQFGIENPKKIAAFRDYLQQLVDDGYIEQAIALTLLKGATLGAIETFETQTQLMIQRQPQRNARDERERSDDLYLDQVKASINEKIDGISERVDALARLSNLSEVQQNARRIEDYAAMESEQTKLDGQIKEIEALLARRLDRFDQQLGTLSDAKFNLEIESLLQQMDIIQSQASERSQSIQSKVDNALFEIYARISQSISASERREQQFIDNELRLFREFSDLRARTKQLEEALEDIGVVSGELSKNQSDPLIINKPPQIDFRQSEVIKNANSQSRQLVVQKSFEETPRLIGAASVLSKPSQRRLPPIPTFNSDD
ncbi:hypothetical protein N9Y18_01725 [Litoricolaceae bacterium]|nr:hypothetical protein [Litorivicinaceae bacterium]